MKTHIFTRAMITAALAATTCGPPQQPEEKAPEPQPYPEPAPLPVEPPEPQEAIEDTEDEDSNNEIGEETKPGDRIKLITAEYGAANVWIDPQLGSIWTIGAQLIDYAGVYPCPNQWMLPTKLELADAGIRGLSLVATNMNASPRGYVNDGYKYCSVIDCTDWEATTVFCLLANEGLEYQKPIYGAEHILCQLKEECEE